MFSRHRITGLLVSLAFVVGLLGACGPKPEPPQVGEINAEPSNTILVGETAGLIIRASGTDLQFEWTVSKGSLSSTTAPSLIYTAPDSPGLDTVTVEVTSKGGSTVRSITFQVVIPPTPTLTATPTATPTETQPPPPLTTTPPPCEGDTSEDLTAQMFEAYDQGNYEKALVCTYELERRWTIQAKEQQAEKEQSDCEYTPDPNNKPEFDRFWADYWALNDVAIGWFVRGEIFRKQGKCPEAREAYTVVIEEYACAYACDSASCNSFWNVAGGARDALSEQCP